MIALLAAVALNCPRGADCGNLIDPGINPNTATIAATDPCRERWEQQLVTEAMWSITGKETVPADAPYSLKNLRDSLAAAIPADRKALAAICPPENALERKGP